MAGTLPETFDASTGVVPSFGAPSGIVPATFLQGTATPFAPSAGTLFGVGSGGGSVGRYRSSAIGSYMRQRQMAALAEAGLPLDPTIDPEAATPESVRSDIEAGIARIATFSPEKAEQLRNAMAQRLPDAGEVDDGGFWDNLRDLGGDMLGMAGKALEIVSRPAQIIPELLADDEDDPWYENISQALSGNSDKRFSDVLEKMGVENGWALGIGGFIGDVAFDPLTYVTFGTAGLGRQAAARVAGKTAGVSVLKGAGLADDVAERMYKQLTEVRKYHEDAAEAVAALGSDLVAKPVQEEMLVLANEATRAVQTVGLKRLPEQIPLRLSDGTAVMKSRSEVISLMEEGRKAKLAGGQYHEAKALAGAVGGARFRIAIPFSNVKYISAPLKGTETWGFGMHSRFFRGLSGSVALNKAVERGAASMDDLDLFFREGYEGLRRQRPELLSELGFRGMKPPSPLVPLSQQMGRITAHLSPHAQAYRGGGLAGLFGADANRLAVSVQDRLTTSWLDFHDDVTGEVVSWDKLKPEMEKAFDVTRSDLYAKFLDLVPAEFFTRGGAMKPLTFFEDTEVRAAVKALMDEAKFSPAEVEAMRKFSLGGKRILKDAQLHGVPVEDLTTDLTGARSLNPRQAREWNSDSNALVRDELLYAKQGDEKVYTHEFGRGFRASTSKARRAAAAPRAASGFAEATPEEFTAARDQMPKALRGFVSQDDAAAIATNRTRVFLNREKTVGFGLAEDGELVMLFKLDGASKGAAKPAIEEAKRMGASHLHAFDMKTAQGAARADKGLPDYYSTFGFDSVESMGWVDEYADDFTRTIPGKPDYVRMELVSPRERLVPVRARLRNPLVIDRRAGAIASDETKLAEITEAAEKLANEEAVRRQAIDTRFTDEAFVNPWVADKVDEIVTDALSGADDAMGLHNGKPYDGVIFIDERGTKNVTVFDQQNVKQVDRQAPGVRANRGYFPRVTRNEVISIIKGERTSGLKYGTPQKIHTMERTLADLDIDEAEREMRKFIKDEYNVTVPENVRILERDPLQARGIYIGRMSKAVAEEQLGYSARRLAWLGDINPHATGGITSRNVYQFSLNDKHLRLLNGLSKHAVKRANQFEHAYSQEQDYVMQTLEREAAGIENLRKALEGDGATLVASSERQAHTLTRRVGRQVERETVAAQKRIAKYEAVLERMRAGTSRSQKTEADLLAAIDEERGLISQLHKLNEGATSPVPAGTKVPGGEVDALVRRTETVLNATQRASRLDTVRQGHIQRLHARTQTALDGALKVDAMLRTNVVELRPALVSKDAARAGFKETGIRGLEGLYMPAPIADEFISAWKGMKDIGDIRHAWRQWVTGPWKKWATVMSPGFHARNNMGAWFNNWMAGTTEEHYSMAYRIRRSMTEDNKWSTTVIEEKWVKRLGLESIFPPGAVKRGITYQDLGMVFSDAGINASGAGALVDIRNAREELADIARGGRKAPSKSKRAAKEAGDRTIGAYARGMSSLTEVTENFHRTAAMLRGLEDGTGLMGARAWTMMRHGDYTDLTDVENFVKDILPFYKWMRTNLPYQIRNLIESPAKQLIPGKAMTAVYEMVGLDVDDEKKKLPEWLRKEITIPVPEALRNFLPGLPKGDDGLAVFSLDLPIQDLNIGAAEFVSQMLPTVMPFFENIIGVDTFTGAPIEGKRVQLSSWAALPGFRQVLDAANLVELDADGNPTIDDRVQNVMSIVPFYSRFRNFLTGDPARTSQRVGAFTSFMLGVGTRSIGDEELTSNEQAFLFDEVQPLIDYLRQLGVTLPDKDQIHPSVFTELGLTPPAEESTD